jgi:hypothetical protein
VTARLRAGRPLEHGAPFGTVVSTRIAAVSQHILDNPARWFVISPTFSRFLPGVLARNSSQQKSRCFSNVSVVKPTDLGKLDHASQFRSQDGSRLGRVGDQASQTCYPGLFVQLDAISLHKHIYAILRPSDPPPWAANRPPHSSAATAHQAYGELLGGFAPTVLLG